MRQIKFFKFLYGFIETSYSAYSITYCVTHFKVQFINEPSVQECDATEV